MNNVTAILSKIESGDSNAAEQLLPLVYQELRRLAAAKLSGEKPGQTLQATALVHEAYLRLVNNAEDKQWDSRGHFFAAAAESMRRLLIDRHRAKVTQKRGGELQRMELHDVDLGVNDNSFDLLALDEALDKLAEEDSPAAELVKLRIFAGLSVEQAGEALGIPRTSAFRNWTYAQAWLRTRLSENK